MWVNSFCHFQPFPKITLFCAEQRSPAQVLRFEISQIGWAGLGWAVLCCAGLVSRDQIFGVSPRPRVFSLVLVSAPRPGCSPASRIILVLLLITLQHSQPIHSSPAQVASPVHRQKTLLFCPFTFGGREKRDE